MNELQIFNYHDKKLRVQKTETGEPLWCLADLCKILGLQDSAVAKRRLDPLGVLKSGRGIVTGKKKNGEDAIQHQNIYFVNEPNLYRLIFQSEKAEAKQIQDWVFNEVLPSIRKTGGYTVDQVKKLELDLKTTKKEIEYLDRKTSILEGEKYELRFDMEKMEKEADRLRWEIERNQKQIKELQDEIRVNQITSPTATRNYLTARVKDYADDYGCKPMAVWFSIYEGLKRRHGVNIQAIAKEMGCMNLDIIESEGYIQHSLDIINHWEEQTRRAN